MGNQREAIMGEMTSLTNSVGNLAACGNTQSQKDAIIVIA